MAGTILLVIIFMLALLTFLCSCTFLVLGYRWGRKTARGSKIFFSYSHKDKEIAEWIMNYLKQYKFRTWVDFGVTIPASELEEELAKAVGDSEVFVLLASKNSYDSQWVAYEIEQSKLPPTSRQRQRVNFRDTLIVSLDEWGTRMHALVQTTNGNEPIQYLKEKEAENTFEDSSVQSNPLRDYVGGVLTRNAKKVLSPRPSFSRIFGPTLKMFDMSESMELGLQQLAEWLRDCTTLFKTDSTGFQSIRAVGFLFWGMGALSSGLIILLFLLRLLMRALQ